MAFFSYHKLCICGIVAKCMTELDQCKRTRTLGAYQIRWTFSWTVGVTPSSVGMTFYRWRTAFIHFHHCRSWHSFRGWWRGWDKYLWGRLHFYHTSLAETYREILWYFVKDEINNTIVQFFIFPRQMNLYKFIGIHSGF